MDEVFAPGPAALSDEWMGYLHEELRESFVKAQVRSRLNALSDDTPLSQDLASVYLDVSDATLKRMRASGKGPQYVQGMSEEGAKSRNQKVLYTVGALKDWIAKNRTDSTGHAAIRRGLMFQNLSDILIPEPWWISHDGVVQGHAFSSEFLENHNLLWCSVLDVLKIRFNSFDCRFPFSRLSLEVIDKASKEIYSLDQATKIAEEISRD